ncbi:alpha/beta hydrolase family protein [Duganella radicis]|uniref:alpha/beta hydrolase family protein n=1 Tax=Duganella radicis TaxID=551988 RepID=UPI001E628395|nr:S9 family peptidase [Duganella radicis]
MTIEQAIQPSGAKSVSLSPDGKHVAIVFFNGYVHELQLYDTATEESKVLSSSQHVTEGFWRFIKAPREVTWAGNDLLAVDYGVEAESINLNGKKVADLGEEVIGRAERDKPDSPWLLVYTDLEDGEIAKVNARTGERKTISYPKGKVISWAFDRGGELRAVSLVNSAFWRDVSTVSNWYRPSGDAEWQKLTQFGIGDDYWVPMFVPDEPHTLAISSRIGRDTYAVFSYDTERRQIGEMMAGHPTQDILSVSGLDQSAFERVSTRGMRTEHVWLDPVWAGVQDSVNQVLPDRINILSGDPRGKVLVYSYSDVEPGAWHLLDMAKGQIRRLASRVKSAAGADMRPMEIMQYAADDGTKVPAFLTRPASGALGTPLVVLIHGGPRVRDYWQWNPEVQILAGHGYAVFQPQFRGSSGFGKRFEEAGFGQWGLAMQDDITAGVRELIRQGIADPKRICIVGASYGGYAALWGLVKTPELYQCGVSFAGVVDIGYMLNDRSDAAGDKVTRELRLTRVGDARTNPEKFDQVSPLKQASRIMAPVLLMHGEDGRRVPIAHGEKMKKALEAAGKHVEWLAFENEGHGLRYIVNEKKYFQTMLAFLDKHLGKKEVDATSK